MIDAAGRVLGVLCAYDRGVLSSSDLQRGQLQLLADVVADHLAGIDVALADADPELTAGNLARLLREGAVFEGNGLFPPGSTEVLRQRLRAAHRRPHGVGDHGDAVLDAHDVQHAGHGLGRRGVSAFDAAAVDRVQLGVGVHHARQLEVDGVGGGAAGLVRDVHARDAAADVLQPGAHRPQQ